MSAYNSNLNQIYKLRLFVRPTFRFRIPKLVRAAQVGKILDKHPTSNMRVVYDVVLTLIEMKFIAAVCFST